MVLTLLPCRLRQLFAAADPELAHIHGSPAAHSGRRKMRTVLRALQDSPAEYQRASQQREYSSIKHVSVVVIPNFIFPLKLCHTPRCFISYEYSYLVWQDTFWYGARSDKVVIGSTAETSLACAPTLTQVTFVDFKSWMILLFLRVNNLYKFGNICGNSLKPHSLTLTW